MLFFNPTTQLFLFIYYHLGCSNTIYYQVFKFILYEGHCNLNAFGHTLRQGTLAPEKQSALKSKNYTGKESNVLANGIKSENLVSARGSVETIAATRIQTAFRAYKV